MEVKIKNGTAYYECGCTFEVADIGPPVRIKFNPDATFMPLDCQRTWDLISDGNTKGVFQLETPFGQQYAKKLKPENMEQLAALSALLRPGATNCIIDGKSITDHYIARKHGEEPVTYFHPDIEPILSKTFGLLTFQEQSMQIAQHFAGFTLEQADSLRKSVGKKLADLMAEVKKEFLVGCENTGILTEEESEELFSWIEKSQRYQFNASHAVSYAYTSYTSAYIKAHFPVSFFTSWLHYAKDKQKPYEEIKLLVNNAKFMDINICPPDLRKSSKHFRRVSNETNGEHYNPWKDKIYFGFGDIKEVGDSAVTKLFNAIYQAETILGSSTEDWEWLDFLLFVSQDINSTTVSGLIESGALDYFGMSRNGMWFEYEQYSKLTDKEKGWIIQNLYSDFKDLELSELIAKAIRITQSELLNKKPVKSRKCFANKNRIVKAEGIVELLKNPPYSLNDSIDWIARVEEAKLGTSLTATIIDSCKNIDQANCSITEFIKHKERNGGIFIACQIDEIKTHIPRNRDDEMAFISVTDGHAFLDCVAFSDVWADMKTTGLCFKDNTILVSGDRSRTSDSLIIKKIWQLT